MTITINFEPRESPGYVPRKSMTLHNIAAVEDHGVRMVKLRKQFTDDRPVFDHVVSVSVMPERE